jgi:response regulator of citrate/malate metabolism
LARLDEASQEDVDALYGLLRNPSTPKPAPTMQRVLDVVRKADGDLDAVEVAERAGISRPTSQRYLAELVKSGLVELSLQYGSTGRPTHRYRATR